MLTSCRYCIKTVSMLIVLRLLNLMLLQTLMMEVCLSCFTVHWWIKFAFYLVLSICYNISQTWTTCECIFGYVLCSCDLISYDAEMSYNPTKGSLRHFIQYVMPASHYRCSLLRFCPKHRHCWAHWPGQFQFQFLTIYKKNHAAI